VSHKWLRVLCHQSSPQNSLFADDTADDTAVHQSLHQLITVGGPRQSIVVSPREQYGSLPGLQRCNARLGPLQFAFKFADAFVETFAIARLPLCAHAALPFPFLI
jgi:hypothetical protein